MTREQEVLTQMSAVIMAGFISAGWDRKLDHDNLRDTAITEAQKIIDRVKERHEV